MLILASRSPQRARLLRDANYAFIQADPPFADPPQPEHPESGPPDARATAAELAGLKALSLRETGLLAGHPGGVILAADTICVGVDGRMIGQPPDRAAAEAMIRGFLNRRHDVVTGVALLGAGDLQPERFAVSASVNMGHVDDGALREYLDSQQWRGKAGGYNLFDRQKAGWPITVEGDATTVVGLPMEALNLALRRRGIVPGPTSNAVLPPSMN